MSRWWIAIGIVVFLSLGGAVVAWRLMFSPLPNEQDVIALYVAHKQEFAELAEMKEKNCTWQSESEVLALVQRIDREMRVFCDYDGTVRFILGVRGLMTIGPERSIGLTYIPGDPARAGNIVSELASHTEEVGSVYLRQIDNHWYVFVQNTD